MEELEASIARLNALWQSGALPTEAYGRAVLDSVAEATPAIKELDDAHVQLFNDVMEKQKEAEAVFTEGLQSQVDALMESLSSESEIREEGYNNQMLLLQAARENELLTEEEYYDQSEALEQAHVNQRYAIWQEEVEKEKLLRMRSNTFTLSNTASFFSSMAGLTRQGGSKLFGISKALASASIVINTAQAAMKAFNVASSLGPIAAGAGAAAAIATGALQLSKVHSTSPSGGGSVGGGGSGGGVSTPSTPPTPSLPNLGTPNVGGSRGGSTVHINLGDDELIDKQGIRNLIEKINTQIRDGVVIEGITV